MRNVDLWKPSKFEVVKGSPRASRDKKFVSASSRLIADVQAKAYYEVLRKYAHGHLLDLGCGPVPLFEMYRDLATEVTCVDWAGSPHQTMHIDVTHDLNTPLPLADQSFDTLVVTDVLEHIRQPELLVSEMARVLRPGGTLILSVPFLYWLHERPHDYHRFTEFKLREFCERRSLEVVELSPYGGAPEVLFDMMAKIGPKFLAPVFQRGGGALCRLPSFERFSKKSAGRFPWGYILVAKKASAS